MPPPVAEQTYMQAMLRHRAGAIEWSRLAQQRAARPELRQFAQRIVTEERAGNIRLRTWLSQWYGVVPTAVTMSPADQQMLGYLSDLTGPDFDIAYMRAMVVHFSETILLACQVLDRTVHSESNVTASAEANTRASDLQRLRAWLRMWYGLPC